MKKNKKSLGGQLLQTGVSFIPGVGQVLAPLVGMIDQQMDANKTKQTPVSEPLKISTNPYGNFAKGGILNDMFKQYNTGSHSSGNDLTVDANGDPNANGTNTVQNKENSYSVDNKQYVFSDVLKHKGKAFSTLASEINKKYPEARTSMDQRKALDLEMKQLSKRNDVARESESTQMAYGGPILGKALQSISDYSKNNLPTAEPNMFTNPDNQVSMLEDNQPVINTNPTAPTNFLPKLPDVPALNQPIDQPEDVSPLVQSSSRSLSPLDSSTANGIALGMKGLALAGSIHDAMQKPENEKLITPNYTKSDKYIQSANVDFTQAKQDAIGVSNIGANMNRSLSGNAAQYQVREQARLAQLQDALGRTSEAENNATSQLNLQKGQYEQGKAVDTANRQYQNQQGNMQNEANSRFFGRQLASDLSQIGSSFNEYAETTKLNKNTADIAKFTNSQIMATINAKNPNFKLNESLVQNFVDGKTSLDEVLTFVPNESKEEVKKILLETKTQTNGK